MGPGEDLHHLPPQVTEVIGIEPSESMRRAAQGVVERTVAGGLPVQVIDAVAEDLPLADDSVDSVLFAYVLCSVEDPEAAVAEAMRVLRPEGTIGVLEHVAAENGSWMRRIQNAVAPVWPLIAAGCRCNQNTREVLASAGLDVSELRDTSLVSVPPVAPALMGTIATAKR